MLDSKHKRGSAMNVTMPWRPWLAEPSGALPESSRISLLKLVASIDLPTAVFGFLRGTCSIVPTMAGRIACQIVQTSVSVTATLSGRVSSTTISGTVAAEPSYGGERTP